MLTARPYALPHSASRDHERDRPCGAFERIIGPAPEHSEALQQACAANCFAARPTSTRERCC